MKLIAMECKKALLSMKSDLLNRIEKLKIRNSSFERSLKKGDEADMSMALLEQNRLIDETERLQKKLLEVEFALGRIETEDFGICEETGEEISAARLKALPWTRLSIEGAEIRESYSKKFSLNAG